MALVDNSTVEMMLEKTLGAHRRQDYIKVLLLR